MKFSISKITTQITAQLHMAINLRIFEDVDIPYISQA